MSAKGTSQGKEKVRKRESYEPPTFLTFLEFFVTWFFIFELTIPAYGAQLNPYNLKRDSVLLFCSFLFCINLNVLVNVPSLAFGEGV